LAQALHVGADTLAIAAESTGFPALAERGARLADALRIAAARRAAHRVALGAEARPLAHALLRHARFQIRTRLARSAARPTRGGIYAGLTDAVGVAAARRAGGRGARPYGLAGPARSGVRRAGRGEHGAVRACAALLAARGLGVAGEASVRLAASGAARGAARRGALPSQAHLAFRGARLTGRARRSAFDCVDSGKANVLLAAPEAVARAAGRRTTRSRRRRVRRCVHRRVGTRVVCRRGTAVARRGHAGGVRGAAARAREQRETEDGRGCERMTGSGGHADGSVSHRSASARLNALARPIRRARRALPGAS